MTSMPNARARVTTSRPMRPRPDNPDGFSSELVAGEPFPVSGFHVVHLRDHVAVDGEEQSERVLCDGGMVDTGGKADRDFQAGGRSHIDLVEADAIFAELSAAADIFEHRPRIRIIPAEDAVKVADKLEHFGLRQRAPGIDDFVARDSSSGWWDPGVSWKDVVVTRTRFMK